STRKNMAFQNARYATIANEGRVNRPPKTSKFVFSPRFYTVWAKTGHLSISPAADIRSGLSLHMWTDKLDEPTLNQVVIAFQYVRRLSIYGPVGPLNNC
ncbi:MAG: hypothetical protein WCA45_05260, partial [Thiobacillaceae bacterium]